MHDSARLSNTAFRLKSLMRCCEQRLVFLWLFSFSSLKGTLDFHYLQISSDSEVFPNGHCQDRVSTKKRRGASPHPGVPSGAQDEERSTRGMYIYSLGALPCSLGPSSGPSKAVLGPLGALPGRFGPSSVSVLVMFLGRAPADDGRGLRAGPGGVV